MLRIKLHNKRQFYTVLGVSVATLLGFLGVVIYLGNQSLHDIQTESKARLAKADSAIANLHSHLKTPQPTAIPRNSPSPTSKPQTAPARTCAISGLHGDPSKVDVVINKKHCFSPIDYAPGDLTGYNGYLLSAKIVPNLTAMLNAAAAAGTPIDLYSSYRSYSNQVVAYNNWVKVNGSTAAADTVSARPSYSEHQTGFALDLAVGSCTLECFRNSAQYTWLQSHAAAYGFIERYPVGAESITGYNPEAWHWRYVGPTTAMEMKTKGIKTLEQLWTISGGGY